MQSDKKLLAVYNKAKDKKEDNYKKYYTFESFKLDAKNFLKDVKKRRTVCTIKASQSGMSRKFNFDSYNMLLNICYNGKMDYNQVFVSGCGMDMHWHLKYLTCERLATKKEIDKNNLNYACSSGKIL
jgi:hypothetical protein